MLTLKKIFLFVAFFGFSVCANAAELPATATTGGPIDRSQLEGWIVKVDYQKSTFRLLDTRGFETYVKTKFGRISDYRMGDKVKVQVDLDRKEASHIEKIY